MNEEEFSIAEELLKQYENYRLLNDYEYFLQQTSNNTWKTAKHLKYLINKIEDVINGKIKRLIINVGPRMGKSEITSKHLPSYLLMRDPAKEIVTVSYSQKLSEKFNREARDHFAEWAPKLTKYQLSKSVSSANFWGVEGHKGSSTATSIGGTLVGKGADILLIDDYCKGLREAFSETTKENDWDWYQSVARTRLSPNGAIIVIATPWSDDDLTGRLISKMNDGTGEQWEIVKLPQFAEENDILNRAVGEVLWPQRFDLQNMLAIKQSVGSYIWQSQYQCSPSPSSGNIFKRSWFKFYDVLPADINNYCISLDATFKDSNTSDYVVMQCWGKNKTDYYLIDQIRDRMDFVTTVQTFKNFCRKHHKARAKYIEDKANGSAIINVLKKEINGLIPINPRDSKEARASAVTPLFEAGNIYLPPNVLWIGDYIEELVTFPLAKNDDMVDCTTQVLNNWKTNSSWSFA